MAIILDFSVILANNKRIICHIKRSHSAKHGSQVNMNCDIKLIIITVNPLKMKNLFKKAKKSVTLGVAKVKSGVTNDAKKRENEDPAFVEHTEKMRTMKSQCAKLTSLFNTLANSIEQLCNSYQISKTAFQGIFTPECPPYYDFVTKSNDSTSQYQTCLHNFSSYYLRNVVMKPITDMNIELDRLNQLREKRKKNKILLQQEEDHLKSAQHKNKDVDEHVEKTKIRRDKFERYNAEFLTGVALLYDRRSEIFGSAFDIYQFYLAELVELQQKYIRDNLTSFPMNDLRQKIPSCSAKPQLSLSTSSSSTVLPTSPYSSNANFDPHPQITPEKKDSSPLIDLNDEPVNTQQVDGNVVVQPTYQSPQNDSNSSSMPPTQSIPVEETNIPLNPYSASDPNMLPNTSQDFPI